MNHCEYRISPREIVSFPINSSSLCCCFFFFFFYAWPLPPSRSHRIHFQAVCERRTVACFNGHKAAWAAGSVACLHEPSRERKKEKKKKRAAIGDARMSQSRSKCVFSQVSWQISALGLACPLYPTGCQLSLRKTERWRIKDEMEGGRGWRWCEDTGPEAFFLSCFSFVSLMITKNMAARETRGRHQRGKKRRISRDA